MIDTFVKRRFVGLEIHKVRTWSSISKQALNGPTRAISSSKIAEGLQGVKKTLNPNFENVTSELWKRYIWTLKTLKQINKKLDHSEWTETSRDRHKSAPYPRLKNSKKTSKCQVFSFTVLENRKFYENFFFRKNYILEKMDRVAHRGPLARWKGTLPKLSTFLSQLRGFCRKTSKIEGENFYFRKKISQCQKNWKGGLWDFPTSILSQNSKKLKGDPLRKKIPGKKSRSVEKKLEGGPFGLAGYGMLRGKTGKTFLVQFARPNSAIWCNNIL